MKAQTFAPADRFADALRFVLSAKASTRELELLRFHAAAPKRTVTMIQVAKGLGFKDQIVANGAYGRLARKVADVLQIPKPKEDFWGILLMNWAPNQRGPHTAFVLRPEVLEAMESLGISSGGKARQSRPTA